MKCPTCDYPERDDITITPDPQDPSRCNVTIRFTDKVTPQIEAFRERLRAIISEELAAMRAEGRL